MPFSPNESQSAVSSDVSEKLRSSYSSWGYQKTFSGSYSLAQVLGIKRGALYILDKCSIIELHPYPHRAGTW
jgi:hypothetical protein